jgi:L-ascorbate metabolism protein UlaG (beta-lactamase superfamily)
MYLRQDVRAEPLFNRWYAWAHLIPPASAAMHVQNLHVKLMRSYIASPSVHAEAAKNPAMTGGQFLDLGGERVDEIRALLDWTLTTSSDLVELAGGIKKLEDTLAAEATGGSLEPMYAKVPEPLRGYVELVYTMSGAPLVRYIEGLLYKSPLFDTKRQSILLSAQRSDHRPFAYSTPRLEDAEHLSLALPFADAGVNDLFLARYESTSPDELAERFGVGRRDLFRSFFTEDAPRTAAAFDGSGVRIRYFGHACVLFETRDVSVLTDPAISYDYPTELRRFTLADLPPRIDYVLLTHTHQDHVMFETLLQIRHRVGTVVVPRSLGGSLEDPSLKRILEMAGFPRVVEVDELETLEIPGGSISGIPFFGEHGDLAVRTKLAHLLRLGDWTGLLAADSNNIEPRMYDHVHAAVGDVDTLFLGMECQGAPYSWNYGPLATKPILRKNDASRRLNGSDFTRAKSIVDRFRCKRVYVYAMGLEPWYGYIMAINYSDDSPQIVESNRLVEYCKERGIQAERLYLRKEEIVA